MHTPNQLSPLAIEAPPQPLMIEGPKVSSDLVPLTYERQLWNASHGTELSHHDDKLTAEQANRINQYYSVDVYVGTHGIVGATPTSSDPTEHYEALVNKPTQKEYQAAAGVVKSLRPGDTLLTEGTGFYRPTIEPVSQEVLDLANGRVAIQGGDPFRRSLAEVGRYVMQSKLAEIAGETESAKQNYQISAWEYARRLAQLQGVPVVHADMDAFDVEAFERIRPRDQISLLRSTDADERAFAQRVQGLRERRARNVLKDRALQQLPPEGSPAPAEGEKPRLVLLFGGGHKDNLKKVFDELGIHVTIHELDKTEDSNERFAEQLAHVVGGLASSMSSLIQSPSGMSASSALSRNAALRTMSRGTTTGGIRGRYPAGLREAKPKEE